MYISYYIDGHERPLKNWQPYQIVTYYTFKDIIHSEILYIQRYYTFRVDIAGFVAVYLNY